MLHRHRNLGSEREEITGPESHSEGQNWDFDLDDCPSFSRSHMLPEGGPRQMRETKKTGRTGRREPVSLMPSPAPGESFTLLYLHVDLRPCSGP